MQNQKKVQLYACRIKNLLAKEFAPRCGIVLGTGLGGLAAKVEEAVSIPYESIPGFPLSTVDSHAGRFVTGYLSGVPVIVQQGRCHLYEGKTPAEVCAGVRVMGALGATRLLLTNAAGAVNPLFDAGGLMLIDDHINLTGQSPLTGPNVEDWGPRFPDMRRVYCEQGIRILETTALSMGVRLEKGVYLGIQGPQLETRAETRAFRMMGADAVGMSTVMEAIAAVHMGMRVTGVSCLSNKNLPDCLAEATLEDIIRVSAMAGETLATILEKALPELAAAC